MTKISVPVRLAIIGVGSRGMSYARLAVKTGRACVVAVAEPDPVRRRVAMIEFGLDPTACYSGYEDFVRQPQLADAVIIATTDRLHKDPAIACASLGYHILLEKPMAPTEEDSRAILEAVEASGVYMMVCHVLRHSANTIEIKRLIDSGAIGRIASVEHLEPIGWWHFAHSYVRGKWGVEAESSSMLLAKCSHDIDWLSFVIGKAALRVSSFGSLMEFRPEQRPSGAASRCLSCAVEQTCPFSANRIYSRFLGKPSAEHWPLGVLTPEPNPESVYQALQNGPYGRCVYDGYNDVVDHQVVNIEYDGGATASFTAVAFSDLDFRKTRVFGTRGSIESDGVTIRLHDFLTDTWQQIRTDTLNSASAADGHGGADGNLIDSFLSALTTPSGMKGELPAYESFRTHQVVWAAERARKSGRVETLQVSQ